MSMRLPTKTFLNYEWEGNSLMIGKIVFGYVSSPEKNVWKAQNLLNTQINIEHEFESKEEAVHWLTDQMLSWLYKAGIIKLP